MGKLAWSGVKHNRGRYLATLVAIITGIAFFSASGFIADRVIASLEGNVDDQYANVDAAVVLEEPDSGDGVQVSPGGDLMIGEAPAQRITSAAGVEGSAGILSAPVAFQQPNGKVVGDGATGRLWITDDELNPVDVAEGRAPEQEGEIALDRGLADELGYAVGEQVTVLSQAGKFPATVVGTTRFGDDDAIDGGGTVSIPGPTAFDWLNRGAVEFQEIYLRGSGSEEDLVAAVEPAVPKGFEAKTGTAFLQDQRDQIGSIGSTLKIALQGFSLLALFVGGFVIYNTFSVIVAQRLRELAVLSAVGATPKQIKRSLRLEGVLIGIIGSLLGLVVGALLTFALVALLGALGVDLPGGGLKISPNTVFQAVFLGTIITWVSVTIPARRAARTEPIEALRQSSADTAALSRTRGIAAAALSALGLAAMLLSGQAVLIGFGAVLLFVGVIVAGPFLAVGGANLIRPVLSRFGLEGRLAVDNTVRNPTRTATTANALVIGVFLVTLVTVAGTSVKDFAVAEINEVESADYIVESDGGTIDSRLVRDIEAIEGVNEVVAVRREEVTIGDQPTRFSTADLTRLFEVTNLTAAEGSLDDLDPGTIGVVQTDGGPKVGDTVTVTDTRGKSEDLEVAAVLEQSIDAITLGSITPPETFDALVGDTAPTEALVDAESGEQTDTKKEIEDLTADRPDITVSEGNAIGQLIGAVFDFVINAVNGLLLMSVAVALIGIINTLSLSILERRRELGLLRIVGMTDDRVRRMVRLESVIISALGTAIGLALGLVLAWVLVFTIDRQTDAGISFGLPVGHLLIVVAAGLLLGFLASLIPARRSTKLEVLDAVSAT